MKKIFTAFIFLFALFAISQSFAQNKIVVYQTDFGLKDGRVNPRHQLAFLDSCIEVGLQGDDVP